jgi:Ribonuclease G/E
MKITKRQLKRIIKEEKQKLLKEWGQEVETGSPLIDFARAYSGLGDAVTEQVDAVVGAYINGGGSTSEEFENTVYEQNGAAIDMAMDKIGRVLHYGDLGDEGMMVLEALEAAQYIFKRGDAEVESDARSAGDL